ncbi:MAG: M23 family metallopeptidase, partial [Clostridiales bacterium]|nr:M23 family metallopeptidase [Clostridiales bacterium]
MTRSRYIKSRHQIKVSAWPFRPKTRRRKTRGTTNRLLRYAAKRYDSVLAVVLVFVLAALVIRLFVNEPVADVVDLADLSAFQIPGDNFRELRRISERKKLDFPELLAVYSREEGFFPQTKAPLAADMIEQYFLPTFSKARKSGSKDFQAMTQMFENVIEEMKKFPIAWDYNASEITQYTYTDTWGSSRTFGGDRVHQGTDLLDKENARGRLTIVSMTDGVIADNGWNQLGGLSIGIRSKSGTYYYYAHLESVASGLKIGTQVKAGQVIGKMGDSGYGQEGT